MEKQKRTKDRHDTWIKRIIRNETGSKERRGFLIRRNPFFLYFTLLYFVMICYNLIWLCRCEAGHELIISRIRRQLTLAGKRMGCRFTERDEERTQRVNSKFNCSLITQPDACAGVPIASKNSRLICIGNCLAENQYDELMSSLTSIQKQLTGLIASIRR